MNDWLPAPGPLLQVNSAILGENSFMFPIKMSNPAGTDNKGSLVKTPWSSGRNSYRPESTEDDAGSHLTLPIRTQSRALKHLRIDDADDEFPPLQTDGSGYNENGASTAGASERRTNGSSLVSTRRQVYNAIPFLPAVPRTTSVRGSRTTVVPPSTIFTISENPLSPDGATFDNKNKTSKTALNTAIARSGGSTTTAHAPTSVLGKFPPSRSGLQLLAVNQSRWRGSRPANPWLRKSQVYNDSSCGGASVVGGPPHAGHRAGFNTLRTGHQPGPQTAPPLAEPPFSHGSAVRHVEGPPNKRHCKTPSNSGGAYRRQNLVLQGSVGATKAQYRTGMIVRAFMHEEYRPRMLAKSLNTPGIDLSRTQTTQGPYVFSKHRPMIIVALFETHYVVVPLYTHGGKGLQYVKGRDEFFSIRDHRSTEPFNKLSSHEPLVTEFLSMDIDPNTTAWVTYPNSRIYDLDTELCGHLDPVSTSRLVAHYRGLHPEATVDSVAGMNNSAYKQLLLEQIEAIKDEARQTDQRISELKSSHATATALINPQERCIEVQKTVIAKYEEVLQVFGISTTLWQ